MSYPFNALNRGVYIADNLAFLRQINDESVDLVNIDPPFGKSKTWPAGRFKPPLTQDELDNEMRLLASWGIATPQHAMAAGLEWPPDSPLKGGYSDIWSWEDDIHEEWVENLRTSYPAVHSLIEVTRVTHSDGHAAYLCFMAVRLIEIHRALKPTGNLFLHCDHTANAYLRHLLDVVFGPDNFRNEIIWERAAGRAKGNQYAPRALGVGTDSIFWYAKSPDAVSHGLYSKLTEAEVQKRFPHKDARGRYNTNVPLFSQPSMGARPNLCYEYKGVRNPHPSGWRVSRERLSEMDANGEIIWRDGKRPLRKSYAAEHRGKPMGNLWNDIPNLTSGSELTGYPTQKPAALAERIIQVSTNEGDIVLDCFAGCAYTAIAAERLKSPVDGGGLESPRLDGVQAAVQQAQTGAADLPRYDDRAAGAGLGADRHRARPGAVAEAPVARPGGTAETAVATGTSVQREGADEQRRDAGGAAPAVRVDGLVLRFRQSSPGRQGGRDDPEFPSGSHRSSVARRHQ